MAKQNNKPFVFVRKVYDNNGALATGLPTELLRREGWQPGDYIIEAVKKDKDGDVIITIKKDKGYKGET